MRQADPMTQKSIQERLAVKPTGFPLPVGEVLCDVVERIVRTLRPEKVILFGSYAYGTPSPDSDVDLLVVMETADRPAERYVAVSRVLSPRPFPVDIIVKTPTEIELALKKRDSFITEIMTQGLILYERLRRPGLGQVG